MGGKGGGNSGAVGPGVDARRLSRGVARGDAAALAEFYGLWFDRCYAMARRLTRRDEAFCLDVVQEAMLRVVRSIRPMRTDAALSAWMARVVRSAGVDMLRKEARRRARERRAAENGGAGGSALALAAGVEQGAWALEALAALTATDRSLIGDRIGRGRTLDEAGAAAGLTGDAAHGRLRRAVAHLRSMAREAFDER